VTSTDSEASTRQTPWPRGFLVAAAALAGIIYLLPLLLSTPLLDPDEGLHAAIAREMVERGDWVTPRLLGEPFLDKPALYFWSLAASIGAFGPTEMAIRLPGLVFGALGALATGLLARRLFGPTTATLAGLIQASMLLPLALTEIAVHDVALVPWAVLAMLALFNASQATTAPRTLAWGSAAGVWLGLAVLTKALTGVALVGLAFAVWCLVHRKLRPALLAAGLLSLLVGAAVAAPWYVAMEGANRGYLHYYFVERHLLGYTTTSQLHGSRPWWYYLPVLLAGSLPWLPFAYRPLRELLRGWRHRHEPGVEGLSLLVIWFCADVAFLSTAGSKLVTYVLPVLPAVAVLAARAWIQVLPSSDVPPDRGWRLAHVLSCVAMAGSLPLMVFAAVAWPAVDASPVAAVSIGLSLDLLLAVGVCVLAWLAALIVALRTTSGHALTATTAALALTVAVGLAVFLPSVAPALTARELARHYNREGRLPDKLWFYDERVGSFLFYLDGVLRSGLTPERIVHRRPDVLLSLRQAPPDTVIVIPVEQVPRLERRIPLSSRPFVQAGHHRAYDAAEFVAALREATDGQ
jgi:4-amino-4-deoxy-L-arabinose transferase